MSENMCICPSLGQHGHMHRTYTRGGVGNRFKMGFAQRGCVVVFVAFPPFDITMLGFGILERDVVVCGEEVGWLSFL